MQFYRRTPKYTRGKLQYTPSNPSDGSSVVDELSLLLTGGRLNNASRNLLTNAFKSSSSDSSGLKLVQKLITTTPEFHSTNTANSNLEGRPELKASESSGEKYKAVSFKMRHCSRLV